MSSGLGVLVTSGDDEINTIFGALEGALDRTTWKSSSMLNNKDGGGTKPIVLLGHANAQRFKTTSTERKPGADIVSRLVDERKLVPSKFGFVFLAGCQGANTNKDGLYIDIGNAINRPVIGSTTSVSMGQSGTQVTFRPINSGDWKVYYPDEGVVYQLDMLRCKYMRETLAELDIVLNDAT